MLELPFGKGDFDCVLAFHSIYHTDYAGLKTVISDLTRLLNDSGQLYITFNSKSNPMFRNPAYKVVDDFTIIKTNKLEKGIPHTYLEYDDILKLLSTYNISKIQHIQKFHTGGTSFHYFVEVEKA